MKKIKSHYGSIAQLQKDTTLEFPRASQSKELQKPPTITSLFVRKTAASLVRWLCALETSPTFKCNHKPPHTANSVQSFALPLHFRTLQQRHYDKVAQKNLREHFFSICCILIRKITVRTRTVSCNHAHIYSDPGLRRQFARGAVSHRTRCRLVVGR